MRPVSGGLRKECSGCRSPGRESFAGPCPAGRAFHWWQATSHALQPMQTVVSVKNPTAWAIARLREAGAGVAPLVPLDNPGGGRVKGDPGADFAPARLVDAAVLSVLAPPPQPS